MADYGVIRRGEADERAVTAELTDGTVSRLLIRLDLMLRAAVERMLANLGPDAAADPFRGLYISRDDAARLLDPWPGGTAWSAQSPLADDLTATDRRVDGSQDVGPELAWLADVYGLSDFDLHVVLLALAPEIDLRYERVYAFLQDDVSRRRPTVDLALNLVCATPEDKLCRRWHFTDEAPLIRNDVVRLVLEPGNTEPSLLANALKVDERIVRRLLGYRSLDPVLRGICAITESVGSALEGPALGDRLEALVALGRQVKVTREPLCLYLSGPPGWAKRQLATAVASGVGMPLLTASLGDASATGLPVETVLRRVLDEARTQQAVLYAEPLDSLMGQQGPAERQRLLEVLTGYEGITILAGAAARPPARLGTRAVVPVNVPVPTHKQRVEYWRACLAAAGEPVTDSALQQLAGRFRLAPEQIADAVTLARSKTQLRPVASGGADAEGFELRELFAAARAQSDPALDGLAHKIEPVHDWTQIVLPEDTLAQLHEMCQQVVYRHEVLDEWGFGRRLSVGKGVTALFAGPSGTGKTMAADIIARELGLDLYKIDLSGVVSKYIGETEKHLERIFTAAENANAILFFDEADALFGKRSEVRDSHDRYANVEVAYLLQKMDRFEGVAILATNLRKNIDEAFVRRLCFAIDFPFPNEEQRVRIWRVLFPMEACREPDIGFDALGSQLRISGGSIKNIVLNAAFLAASAEQSIGMQHLLHATRREYQKMGKVLSADLDLDQAGASAFALAQEGGQR
jgi:SpoVK/Ycf46/Vps4 family AAA+-type ATPase